MIFFPCFISFNYLSFLEMLLNLNLELCGCSVSQTEYLFRAFYYYSIFYNHIEKPYHRDIYSADHWFDIQASSYFKPGSPRYKTITKARTAIIIIPNMYLISYFKKHFNIPCTMMFGRQGWWLQPKQMWHLSSKMCKNFPKTLS